MRKAIFALLAVLALSGCLKEPTFDVEITTSNLTDYAFIRVTPTQACYREILGQERKVCAKAEIEYDSVYFSRLEDEVTIVFTRKGTGVSQEEFLSL